MSGGARPSDEEMDIESKANFNRLRETLFNASISLQGNHETYDIQAGDLIHVNVVLPDGSSHWSSGFWMVTEAVHLVAGEYTIECQLQRDKSNLGREVDPNWDKTTDLLYSGVEDFNFPDEDYGEPSSLA